MAKRKNNTKTKLTETNTETFDLNFNVVSMFELSSDTVTISTKLEEKDGYELELTTENDDLQIVSHVFRDGKLFVQIKFTGKRPAILSKCDYKIKGQFVQVDKVEVVLDEVEVNESVVEDNE